MYIFFNLEGVESALKRYWESLEKIPNIWEKYQKINTRYEYYIYLYNKRGHL